jgi:protein-S-isoprenylcysteine O-methyltransferase Ste14
MLPIVIGHAIWVTFVIAWNVSDTRTPTVATPGAQRERLYKLAIALGMVLIVLAVRRPLPLWTNPPILAWALLLVVAAGIAFCWWARVHLGALWSAEVTRKDAHRVVDSGPYGLVRHPIYTGFIVMYAGLVLLSASALGLAGFLLMTTGLWLKARLEEDFLMGELGAAAYGDYRARTPMLVPRVPGR